jgi:hypothetical protein
LVATKKRHTTIRYHEIDTELLAVKAGGWSPSDPLKKIEKKMLELQRRKGALAEGLFDSEAGGPLDITADDIDLLLAAA